MQPPTFSSHVRDVRELVELLKMIDPQSSKWALLMEALNRLVDAVEALGHDEYAGVPTDAA